MRPVLRLLSIVAALACAGGMAREFRAATDFPEHGPVTRVDAALVARLRASPGLHVALAPGYVLEVPLEMVDDPENKRIYDTDIDMREAVERRSIHIQRRKADGRAAIHADNWNPRAGLWPKVVHGTIDVPMIPLAAGVVLGGGGFVVLGRRRRATHR